MTRIIAGSRRGRRIAVPPGDATRPTTDRVREALFSAIAAWAGTADAGAEASLRGLAVADLFAGSGAVGLEAASRGADPVLLVESSARTGAVIARNVTELGLGGQVTARIERVERLVRTRPARTYDVVFVDPPYAFAEAALADILAGVVGSGWVAPDGLVVVERSRRDAGLSWPPGFEEGWRRDYGETTLIFGGARDAEPDVRATED
ncbi:16S rRNA (guanine(966)-N(2))-methyltransferase RsmD [Microlunatus ginsengisoli]|uniref:16S rRNA (Guanine(966)-N(2))-methyltransferase RsmD n=1 Tax=Microlunatus ginsengisoli TaxID=363863 RepID=A0ABP7A6M4_9ACTN